MKHNLNRIDCSMLRCILLNIQWIKSYCKTNQDLQLKCLEIAQKVFKKPSELEKCEKCADKSR